MSTRISIGLCVAWAGFLSTGSIDLTVRADRADTALEKLKKIVLIAGKKSHGPGTHEYAKSVKLLKVMLDTAPNLERIQTEIHFDGWPKDPRTLDDADVIMIISDGLDDNQHGPVSFMTPERMKIMARQMQRGCGFITFHYSTISPDRLAPQILEWGGGYFDWQDDTGKRNGYSAYKTLEAKVELAAPDHPIARGLEPFEMREEFYYQMRFRPNDARRKPIWYVPALGGTREQSTVAWAVERADGGRGFGTTVGHFYDNWKVPDFRKMILNAIVWTAGAVVPPGGVESRFFTDDQVDVLLNDQPIHALILTGHQYPGHPWRKTTPVLKAALEQDPRIRVAVSERIEILAGALLQQYDLLVLN